MSRHSVLIADSNKRLADVMAQLLADEPGYQVVAITHDAQQALSLAQSEQPDVVLVSEFLGEVEGREVCAALRPVLPEAALLVWSHEPARTAARPQVVDAVLDRGMTFRELLRSIRRARRVRLDPRRLSHLRR